MFFVISGDDYPCIIQTCKSKRQQMNQYKKRKDSGAWKRVEMVTGNYSLLYSNNWEVCNNEKMR